MHASVKLDTLRIANYCVRKIYFVLLSYTNIIWQVFDKEGSSVLDIGVGNGLPMQLIRRRKKFFALGIDIFLPYIKNCKHMKIHDDYVLCDVRFLPFKEKTFDVVLCLQVIEHLTEYEAHYVIQEIENIASRQLILTTPLGFLPRGEVDGNPFEAHKSGFHPKQFEVRGYKIKRQGLRLLFGENGIVHQAPHSIVSKSIFALDLMLELLLRMIPRLSDYYIVCYKKL